MATIRQATEITYSITEAAELIAADVAFVVQAIGQGLVSVDATGRFSEDTIQSLQALYVSSGQALCDLTASAVDEGWYDTTVGNLRALGVVAAESQGESVASLPPTEPLSMVLDANIFLVPPIRDLIICGRFLKSLWGVASRD